MLCTPILKFTFVEMIEVEKENKLTAEHLDSSECKLPIL